MLKIKQKRLVRNFVRDIDPDFKVSFTNTFEVDIFDEHIYATFHKNPDLDRMFLDFLEEEFGIKINMFLISLLHEIGHIMTYDDNMDDKRDMTYGLLRIMYEEGKSDIEAYNKAYFNIEAEYMATAWGVQYYLDNKEKCDNFISAIDL